MFASAFHLIPREHVIYPILSKHLLPPCLVLLLLGVDLSRILKLGPVALTSMAVGTFAILSGGPLLLYLFKPWLPADAWLGLSALAASWTGGSANMIAVKEAIGTPDALFSVMVIVDSIVTYFWMGILIELSSFQKDFDQWNGARVEWLEELGNGNQRTEYRVQRTDQFSVLSSLLSAFLLGEFAIFLGQCLASPVINAGTWAVILATGFGLVLSFFKYFKREEQPANQTGLFLLYLLLASIGARADLAGIFRTPVFLLVGVLWVSWMALILFLVGKLFRIPLFFLATASQANVGGTASATIVAGVYQPHLSFVGLLLAILGNIFGTYLGIGVSYVMRWVMQSH